MLGTSESDLERMTPNVMVVLQLALHVALVPREFSKDSQMLDYPMGFFGVSHAFDSLMRALWCS